MPADKFIFKIVFLFIGGMLIFSCRGKQSAQDNLVGQHRENKVWSFRKWKKESKNGTPYNPVLHSKTKPSTIEARENKKTIRKAKRAVRKEKRRLRRTKGAYQKPK